MEKRIQEFGLVADRRLELRKPSPEQSAMASWFHDPEGTNPDRVRKRTRSDRRFAFRSAGGCDFVLGALARQRIVGALIELPNPISIETLLFNFEICAQQQFRRQFLYGEANGFGRSRKALVANRPARLPAPARKQFGRGTVVDHRHNQRLLTT